MSSKIKPLEKIRDAAEKLLETTVDDYIKSQFYALIVFMERDRYDFLTFASKIIETDVKLIPEETIGKLKDQVKSQPRKREKLIAGKELFTEFSKQLTICRAKTNKIFDLPDNVSEKTAIYSDSTVAYVKYYGNFKSTVLINPKIPRTKLSAQKLAVHEFHPGHLSHYEMREAYPSKTPLVNTFVYMTPDATVVEGIGEFAWELLTGEPESPAEELRAMAANNATIAYFSGTSKKVVADYLMSQALYTPSDVDYFFKFRGVPFFDVYSLSYYYGRKLIKAAYLNAVKINKQSEFLTFLYQNQLSPNMIKNRRPYERRYIP